MKLGTLIRLIGQSPSIWLAARANVQTPTEFVKGLRLFVNFCKTKIYTFALIFQSARSQRRRKKNGIQGVKVKEDYIRYTLRLTKEQNEQLKNLAKKNGLTSATMIRFLIMQELNKKE